MVSQQQEREDKFDVDVGFVVPELTDLLPVEGRLETATYRLNNTYYDTSDGDLQRLHLTLRQRVGGPDAGWHLKIPSGPARTEVRSRSRSRSVPRALADPLLGVCRGQELAPVAGLSVTRDVVRLLTTSGDLVAEVADDSVESATMGETSTVQSWREIEVELGPAGDEPMLSVIGDRLLDWGARRSTFASKLRRALGSGGDQTPGRDLGTLGGLVGEYIAAQCLAIYSGDLGIRLNQAVVHPTRVGVRRLRSTLRIFSPLFDTEKAAALEEELIWFAGLLGEVRDRDILRERLLGQVAELPGEYVLGPVASQIESTLQLERSRYLKRVVQEMKGDRYRQLLDRLNEWWTAPPFTEQASQPSAAVGGYIRRAERKLNKRLRNAGGDVEALHRARKAGKRFRYAAELSEPALGKKASKAVKEGKRLQELLGEHQDSVVSAMFLRRLGSAAGASPDQNGFTFGVLLANEWHRAEKIRHQLAKRYG